eukprot:PLAT4966.2.p4 GENE.PLAT4966.2~~PLAT4966.2.p4  ORF type:complete len:239 (+),score=114.07 PLAT4966.2:941-1657(+)
MDPATACLLGQQLCSLTFAGLFGMLSYLLIGNAFPGVWLGAVLGQLASISERLESSGAPPLAVALPSAAGTTLCLALALLLQVWDVKLLAVLAAVGSTSSYQLADIFGYVPPAGEALSSDDEADDDSGYDDDDSDVDDGADYDVDDATGSDSLRRRLFEADIIIHSPSDEEDDDDYTDSDDYTHADDMDDDAYSDYEDEEDDEPDDSAAAGRAASAGEVRVVSSASPSAARLRMRSAV